MISYKVDQSVSSRMITKLSQYHEFVLIFWLSMRPMLPKLTFLFKQINGNLFHVIKKNIVFQRK